MNFIKTISAAGFALAAISAHAQEAGILLSFKVERDGQLVSKPRVLTKSGSTATIQRDSDLKIEVTPADRDGVVDVSMKLYVLGADGLKIAATPRVVVNPNTASTIEFQSAGEPSYRISLVASPHIIGTPLPAAQ